MLYDNMLLKSRELASKIKALETKIATLPGGNFFCSRNGGRYKWFHNDGHHQIYIPKKNRQLAEQLATRKYLSLQSEELQQEKRAIDFYLRHHSTASLSRQLLAHPEYQELLKSYFSLPEASKEWSNVPYPKNPKHPEHLIHKTISGNLVRSKSETIIDMVLYTNRIPYRYECALELDEFFTYPDFTIMHPITGKLFYWEHFGLMDDPQYCQKHFLKLQNYVSHGIIPSINLITTYETKNHPLDPELVENLVKHYFL